MLFQWMLILDIYYLSSIYLSTLVGLQSGSEPEILVIAETFKTEGVQTSISYTLRPRLQGRNKWKMLQQKFLINN